MKPTWKSVTREEFHEWLRGYPRHLFSDGFNGDRVTYNDGKLGKWPKSVVAKFDIDYESGEPCNWSVSSYPRGVRAPFAKGEISVHIGAFQNLMSQIISIARVDQQATERQRLDAILVMAERYIKVFDEAAAVWSALGPIEKQPATLPRNS